MSSCSVEDSALTYGYARARASSLRASLEAVQYLVGYSPRFDIARR